METRGCGDTRLSPGVKGGTLFHSGGRVEGRGRRGGRWAVGWGGVGAGEQRTKAKAEPQVRPTKVEICGERWGGRRGP